MILFSNSLLSVYLILLTMVTGLLFGSALNCLAYRLARDEKWSSGRSHCPVCHHALYVWDLIPLFSYIFQKGKCRYCGCKISKRYPLTELLLSVVYLSILLKFDISLETVQLLIFCSCLFCLSLIDLDIQIIPDRFQIIIVVTRIGYILITYFYNDLLLHLWYSLWHGLLLGGSVFVISLIMDKILHKESIGGGDIKLLFVLGLFFDLPCCFFLLLLSCFIGIGFALYLNAHKGIAFPFGPALSVAAWITLLFGKQFTSWYMGLFI